MIGSGRKPTEKNLPSTIPKIFVLETSETYPKTRLPKNLPINLISIYILYTSVFKLIRG